MRVVQLLGIMITLYSIANAQTINPATQIEWPAVTGSGAPTASCGSSNYGQPYTDVTNNVSYTCSTSGWVRTPGSLPLSGGTLSGPMSAPAINGSLNPLLYAGTDFGLQVNAAIAAASAGAGASGYGIVTIPPGSYTFADTISLTGYQNIILDCQGANLTYTGSTIAIDALQSSSSGGPNATGGIENCNVYAPATAASNVTAFRFGNVLNYRFLHNSAWNFNASGDTGLLVENTTYFTEDSIIADNQMRQVTIGYEFQKNCSSGAPNCTNSAEYTFFKNNYYNSPYDTVSGAAGLMLTGGITLQNAVVELHGNINGPSGGDFIELATANDQMLRDQVALQSEADGSPTTAYCVLNNGMTSFVNGTLQCDEMSNAGTSGFIVFGSDGGYVGNESMAIPGTIVATGASSGASSNVLPDSEDVLGGYWQAPIASFEAGTSPANTGHTDYGYWNTGSGTISCATGAMYSQPFYSTPWYLYSFSFAAYG